MKFHTANSPLVEPTRAGSASTSTSIPTPTPTRTTADNAHQDPSDSFTLPKFPADLLPLLAQHLCATPDGPAALLALQRSCQAAWWACTPLLYESIKIQRDGQFPSLFSAFWPRDSSSSSASQNGMSDCNRTLAANGNGNGAVLVEAGTKTIAHAESPHPSRDRDRNRTIPTDLSSSLSRTKYAYAQTRHMVVAHTPSQGTISALRTLIRSLSACTEHDGDDDNDDGRDRSLPVPLFPNATRLTLLPGAFGSSPREQGVEQSSRQVGVDGASVAPSGSSSSSDSHSHSHSDNNNISQGGIRARESKVVRCWIGPSSSSAHPRSSKPATTDSTAPLLSLFAFEDLCITPPIERPGWEAALTRIIEHFASSSSSYSSPRSSSLSSSSAGALSSFRPKSLTIHSLPYSSRALGYSTRLFPHLRTDLIEPPFRRYQGAAGVVADTRLAPWGRGETDWSPGAGRRVPVPLPGSVRAREAERIAGRLAGILGVRQGLYRPAYSRSHEHEHEQEQEPDPDPEPEPVWEISGLFLPSSKEKEDHTFDHVQGLVVDLLEQSGMTKTVFDAMVCSDGHRRVVKGLKVVDPSQLCRVCSV